MVIIKGRSFRLELLTSASWPLDMIAVVYVGSKREFNEMMRLSPR